MHGLLKDSYQRVSDSIANGLGRVVIGCANEGALQILDANRRWKRPLFLDGQCLVA